MLPYCESELWNSDSKLWRKRNPDKIKRGWLHSLSWLDFTIPSESIMVRLVSQKFSYNKVTEDSSILLSVVNAIIYAVHRNPKKMQTVETLPCKGFHLIFTPLKSIFFTILRA